MIHFACLSRSGLVQLKVVMPAKFARLFSKTANRLHRRFYDLQLSWLDVALASTAISRSGLSPENGAYTPRTACRQPQTSIGVPSANETRWPEELSVAT
jgi:hypothetical protein